MDDTSELLLRTFAREAQAEELQAEDWLRFYLFILHVHLTNLPIKTEEVRARLRDHGLPPEFTRTLAMLFEHCCGLLTLYDHECERPRSMRIDESSRTHG